MAYRTLTLVLINKIAVGGARLAILGWITPFLYLHMLLSKYYHCRMESTELDNLTFHIHRLYIQPLSFDFRPQPRPPSRRRFNSVTVTRGHRYKLYVNHSRDIRKHFFAEPVVAPWNSLPADTDFSSLNSFKRSISTVDFSKFLIAET